MKTKLWNKLTWDLRIVYNKLTKDFILQKYDCDWQNYYSNKEIKKAIKVKHGLIKKRVKQKGLFNKIC